jgi:hypothetical protein
MITEPVYIDVPIFATLGTKVEPDAGIFTNGYAVDTVLPTEHLSYFFNGFTSNDITVEEAVDALIVELTAILTAAGLTPNPLITNQILLSLNSLYANTAGGSSLAGTTTVTGTLTSSGGTISGSWAGSPTFSGTPVFSGTPTVSGTLTSSGGSMTGTWAGNATFSGTRTISGTLTSSGGTLSGSWAGSPTFSGNPTFSAQSNFSADISLGSSAGILENSVAIKRKVIDIGDWNMTVASNVNVNHGLTLSTIRSITVIIRNDANTQYYGTYGDGGGGLGDLSLSIRALSTQVELNRGTFFDSTNFDSTSYNRGWITVEYSV